jgi:putative flippase GtrA
MPSLRSPFDSVSLPARLDTPRVRRLIAVSRPYWRLIPFALVGASGLVVNSAILGLATEKAKLYYLWSAVLATCGSTSWNFTLTELWVFRDRRRPGWLKRLGMFFVMNNAAFLVRGPIMYGLTTGLGVHYQISNLVSIVVMTLVRFVFSDRWIWRSPGPRPAEEKRLG